LVLVVFFVVDTLISVGRDRFWKTCLALTVCRTTLVWGWKVPALVDATDEGGRVGN
jgi:hypothetical protein